MKTRSLFLSLTVFLFGTFAEAQVTNGRSEIRQCTPLGCRVQTGYFSAVSIGMDSRGRNIYLTCAHCLEGVQSVSLGIDAKWRRVTVLSVGSPDTIDIGLLALDGDSGSCFPLAEKSPGARCSVTTFGIPGGKSTLSTRYSTVESADGNSLWVRTPFLSGESGGAVVAGGKLVGVISSTPINGRGPGRAVAVETVRTFVMEHLGEIPKCVCDRKAPPPPTEDTKPPMPPPIVPDRPQPPTAGVPGPAGPRGPQGPPGSPANVETLSAEIAKLKQEIASLRATKIPVEMYDADTKQLIDRRLVPLGQPIQISKSRKAK